MRSGSRVPSPVRSARHAGLLAAVTVVSALPLGAQTPPADPAPDSTLAALSFLAGRWMIPPGDPLLEQRPEIRGRVVLEAQWTVGGKALTWREGVRGDGPDGAELEGMVYWNPATERIEYLAVAGRADGQGRLFVGELRPMADGRVLKTYDVHYRTLADIPGEELGGLKRSYREILEPLGDDGWTHSLDWWLDGAWQPFGRGRYDFVRAPG